MAAPGRAVVGRGVAGIRGARRIERFVDRLARELVTVLADRSGWSFVQVRLTSAGSAARTRRCRRAPRPAPRRGPLR